MGLTVSGCFAPERATACRAGFMIGSDRRCMIDCAAGRTIHGHSGFLGEVDIASFFALVRIGDICPFFYLRVRFCHVRVVETGSGWPDRSERFETLLRQLAGRKVNVLFVREVTPDAVGVSCAESHGCILLEP